MSCSNIESGASLGFILGPLFFLIYINDSSDGLNSNPNLFADANSLFSVVHDRNSAANNLNSYLMKISNWDFQ